MYEREKREEAQVYVNQFVHIGDSKKNTHTHTYIHEQDGKVLLTSVVMDVDYWLVTLAMELDY